MSMDNTIKGTTDIEVIKHRIYEVQGCGLKSQLVTSSLEFPACKNNTRFAVKNFDHKSVGKESLNQQRLHCEGALYAGNHSEKGADNGRNLRNH